MRSSLILFAVCLVLSVACEDRSIAISAETQLAIDIEKIDKYLAENGITAQNHPSGLRFVVAQPGNGERPGPETCVRVNYSVWRLGEADPFETGSNVAITLSANKSILGWRIGLKEIQKGGLITLYIPSGLAYGKAGTRKDGEFIIQPDQVLIFDVEVLNITTYNTAGQFCNPWP